MLLLVKSFIYVNIQSKNKRLFTMNIKKLFTILTFLCCTSINLMVMSMEQNNTDALKYIPLQSKMRVFCENNQQNQNALKITTFLAHAPKSKEITDKLDFIEFKMNALKKEQKQQEEAKKCGMNSESNTILQERINELESTKERVSKEDLFLFRPHNKPTFEHAPELNDAITNILKKNLNIKGEEIQKEKNHLNQGFLNAWNNDRPWNTKTRNEKLHVIGFGSLGLGMTILFGLTYRG